MFQRLQILLPHSASTLWREQRQYSPIGHWDVTTIETPTPFDTSSSITNDSNVCYSLLLHAACYVPCPVTVIQFILLHLNKKQLSEKSLNPISDCCHPLQYRDTIASRYPLHYAATRVSYRNLLPIGFTMSTSMSYAPNQSHVLQEDVTPVQIIAPLYPEACSQRDACGQLPLHIAIDTYKRHRMESYERLRRRHKQQLIQNAEPAQDDFDELSCYDLEEDTVIQLLIQLYPPSIHIRDENTMLYPFQQAAVASTVGTSSNYDTASSAMERNRDTKEKKENDDEYDDNDQGEDHGCRLTTIYQLLRFNPTLLD